ncbi:unnamed protein product [Durusdinium trenchii]|uniref:Uncharacterized protein n=2 Tax=Durusdinium trenchii TaxID=1381693 RepID=A0ABP0LQ87_9DINO
MGAAASAASRRAAEALAQRWAFLVAEQGDAEELQALADELHTQTNGQVVPLLRRVLSGLDLGLSWGTWRWLKRSKEDEGQSWLQPPLTSLELDGLLCALQLARPELREVLLELADPYPGAPRHCPSVRHLPCLASLWVQQTVSALRVHRVASAEPQWQAAKELAYFHRHQLPLVDPRPAAMCGLQQRHLRELLHRHKAWLQESVYDEVREGSFRPSCWQFYSEIARPCSTRARCFAEVYPPQEVTAVVSHCWKDAFEDLLLALEQHVTKSIEGNSGYWLSLLALTHSNESITTAQHRSLLAAFDSCDELVVVWDTDGRWPTRLWCLYELTLADEQKEVQVTSLQGLLGSDRTVAASRAAARRLLAARPGEGRSVPQARPEELGQVKAWLGEKGQEKMERSLLALAGPLFCLGDTVPPAVPAAPVGAQCHQLISEICAALPSGQCLVIEAPPGHRRSHLARLLVTQLCRMRRMLPVHMRCAVLTELKDESKDFMKLWLGAVGCGTCSDSLPLGAIVVLEALEEVEGSQVGEICTWATRWLEGGNSMIITTRCDNEFQPCSDVVSLDLAQLTRDTWREASLPQWPSALRVVLKDGRLQLKASSVLGRPVSVDWGLPSYIQLLRSMDLGPETTCFAVYESALERLRLSAQEQVELEELALKLCCQGKSVALTSPSLDLPFVLRPLGIKCKRPRWQRFRNGTWQSFFAAKALLRRNDLAPQVLSQQWPQVRHFLRRGLEQWLTNASTGARSVREDWPVLQRRLMMAIQLDADVNVLRPLLSPASENGVVGALACEALEHWLAAGVEEHQPPSKPSAQLPRLVSLCTSLGPAEHQPLDTALVTTAQALVRLEELKIKDFSYPELLLTLHCAAALEPEIKWPMAQRFFEKMEGRVAGLEEWTQVVKVAELADVPMAMLERLLQDFLQTSRPAELRSCAQLLRGRRSRHGAALGAACGRWLQRWHQGWLEGSLSAGRYHSVLLHRTGAVAVGLNGAGESTLPPLPEGVRYVASACGVQHTLLLRSDGRVAACGLNLDGQTAIPACELPIVAVAAGGFHSVLLEDSGQCLAFGCNAHGQCDLPFPQGPYMAIAAGRSHTLALRQGGRHVDACGAHEDGQTAAPDLALVVTSATSLPLKYVACAAGGRHSVLLRNDGKAVAFGWNFHGQCDLPSDGRYRAVACGENHTVLLAENGLVWAAGEDQHGQCQASCASEF